MSESSEAVSSNQFGRMVIIGVGLIGGSLGQALRRKGVVEHVVGVGRTQSNLDDAIRVGAIDSATSNMAEAVRDADVIVVATPISQMPAVFKCIGENAKPTTVITDVGSVKAEVVEFAAQNLGDRFCRFAPSHPIAGTEKSGAAASFAELFENHWTILTPHADTNTDALQTVDAMWRSTKSDLLTMSVEDHDAILARSSHLPHALAFALVYQLATDPDHERHFQLCGGGFFDFTRIAASDPKLWRDICLANKPSVVSALDGYLDVVTSIRDALNQDDGDKLEEVFATAQKARAGMLDRRQL